MDENLKAFAEKYIGTTVVMTIGVRDFKMLESICSQIGAIPIADGPIRGHYHIAEELQDQFSVIAEGCKIYQFGEFMTDYLSFRKPLLKPEEQDTKTNFQAFCDKYIGNTITIDSRNGGSMQGHYNFLTAVCAEMNVTAIAEETIGCYHLAKYKSGELPQIKFPHRVYPYEDFLMEYIRKVLPEMQKNVTSEQPKEKCGEKANIAALGECMKPIQIEESFWALNNFICYRSPNINRRTITIINDEDETIASIKRIEDFPAEIIFRTLRPINPEWVKCICLVADNFTRAFLDLELRRSRDTDFIWLRDSILDLFPTQG